MNLKDKIELAKKLGKEAFLEEKMRAPALNQKVINLLAGIPVGGGGVKILKAYTLAWDKENLK